MTHPGMFISPPKNILIAADNLFDPVPISEGGKGHTNDDIKDTDPWINGLGQIAWRRMSGEPCTAAEIFFYNGETITQITDNGVSNQRVKVNDSGMITASAFDFCPDPWECEVFV
ncbi:MAG: hypothetical protein IIC56_09405, partial [Proteobacteria bacterium]|nr:hypothetical protein [Pseudomonadota bacterium]